jgi:subfamily B ATP-binding cassette protein HlyB/CyaB
MQTGLIVLELLGRFNKTAIDTRNIVREYGLTDNEITPEMLIRISRKLGFKTKIKQLTKSNIHRYPLPALIFTKEGDYGILLKHNHDAAANLDEYLGFFPSRSKDPMKLTFETLSEITEKYIVSKFKLLTEEAIFGFKWFYREILNYKRIVGEVLLASFVVQLFGLVTPLFTQVILDKVLVHHSMSTLNVIAAAFLIVAVFEFLMNVARNHIFIHTAGKLDAKLGSKLFRHLVSLPFIYFEARQVGVTVARVRELDTIRDFITNKSLSAIIDVIFSSVFVVIMFVYSVKLALIALSFITVIGIIYLTVTPELRRRLDEKFANGARSNSYLVESVTGIQTVKSLAIEGSMQRKWEEYLAKYVRSTFNMANFSTFFSNLAGTLQKLMTISVLYFGVTQVIEGRLSVGQLIAFQMFCGQFSGPILRLVNLWNEFQQALLSVDRLGDILNHPTEQSTAKAITLQSINGDVKFDNISFTYAPDLPNVIEGFSLHVTPGMSIGIVGKSGSGKSTLAKLLQRLYLTRTGAIYVDGVDVQHISPLWLRNNIGVVLQENYLFSGTIRDNISLARADAPMDMIVEAAKAAGAHDFITELSHGYDTQVGERGTALSGGQRQRIAIARALITNPSILIFDEATSALDYESERIIQDNLKKIKAGRTMFIIAHRLSTVRECDRIVVLEKGKLIEDGNHTSLLDVKGYYYSLYKYQAQ